MKLLKKINFFSKGRHYRPNSFNDKKSWEMNEKDVGKKLAMIHSEQIVTDVEAENIQVGNMEPRQVILKLEKARNGPTLYSRFINNSSLEDLKDESNNNSALISKQHESEELYAIVTKKNQTQEKARRANSYSPETNQGISTLFSSSPLNSDMRCTTIMVPKNYPSIGISISGGKCIDQNRYIRIVALHPGGAADETNLEVGQVIISVDGTSLLDVTHEEAVDLIRSSYLRNDSSSMELSVASF